MYDYRCIGQSESVAKLAAIELGIHVKRNSCMPVANIGIDPLAL